VAGISETVVRALVPYVGATVADTCVRATAISIGKSFDILTTEDLPALEERARRLLAPLLPKATIDRVVAEFRGGVL